MSAEIKSSIAASCSICVYSRRVRVNTHDITGQLICVRFPPTAIIMMQPKGQAMGSAHPIVQPGQMCYEFKHDPEKVTKAVPILDAANDQAKPS